MYPGTLHLEIVVPDHRMSCDDLPDLMGSSLTAPVTPPEAPFTNMV